MLEDATASEPNQEEGRWKIETRHFGRAWNVIVEPLMDESTLLVVTAYSID